MLTYSRIDEYAKVSSFSTPDGCDEIFMTIDSEPGSGFADALRELTEKYSKTLKRTGLPEETAAFSRLFVSDINNQQRYIRSAPIAAKLMHGALSIIEQKPADGGPVSLLSYHVRRGKGAPAKRIVSPAAGDGKNSVLITGSNYSLLFTANSVSDHASDVQGQTTAIFESLEGIIAGNAMRLTHDTVRTWVFVRDIDNNYQDMVTARRTFFSARGLTGKTHFPASTGIQGTTAAAGRAVSVDSFSVGGCVPGQIIRMEAQDHLPPAMQYGVTFERGLRVRFGDRSHLYISGTASINNKGEVLFAGDAARQTQRTVENIRALLAAHHASVSDMAYFIAYIRTLEDREKVRDVLAREIGTAIPLIFAEGAVCRPEWLVELEGVAIMPDKTGFPPFI